MVNLFNPVFFIFIVFMGITAPVLIIGISSAVTRVEKSKEEIKRKQTETDAQIEKKIKELEAENQECKQKKLIKRSNQISRKIHNLQKSREKFQLQSAMIIKKHELLNYKDGLLLPGIFILFSIVFTFLGTECVSPIAVFTGYFFAFLFLLIGFFRIFKCLKIITDVRARSKKYEQERIYEVFHRTFDRHDEAG